MTEVVGDVSGAAAKRWLLSAKAQPPGVVSGYYRRTDLLDIIEPVRHLTVLRAPGGFGKTALLADLAQRWQSRGLLAAWLTLDEDDTPGIVEDYLALAFKVAGLELLDMEDVWLEETESELPHRTRRRAELLAIAIEAHAAPCLLVLDDVECLAHTEAVETVNFLVQSGPRNLHVAVAMRDNPGLDLGKAVVDSEGIQITTDELRFSVQQIDDFFDGGLSLRELAALERRTEGWPIALRMFRNMKPAIDTETPEAVQQMATDHVNAEWFGERLLRDLSQSDSELLLDVALFEWITPALAKEVLQVDDVRQRIGRFGALEGLLQQGQDDNLRLNPLLREYCAARHRQQDLSRYRMLHRRIAEVEAREGRVVPALRHAAEASDTAQVGELLEDAGGVRLWARFGVKSLMAVDEFLTPAVIDAFPRAALLRCTVLALQSRFAEAFAQYQTLKATTRDFRRDRAGGDDAALYADHVLVQATLAGFACMPLDSTLVQDALVSVERMVADDDLDPVVEGALNLSLNLAHQQRARFDAAHRCGAVAKAAFDRAGAAYGGVFINLALGTLAMAQGRVRDASDHYGHGAPTAIADILSWELEHERTCNPQGSTMQNVPVLPEVGWLDVYAAAYGVAAELAFDTQAALFSVDQARDYARDKNLATVARFLSALRISWLVKYDLTAQAERSWQQDGLPNDDTQMLDVDRQSWRQMEALACGRIRLLIAQGQFAVAGELARRLCRLADERGLRRVLMNAIALAITAEYRNGQMLDAISTLADFLRIAEETDYYRPLARESDTVLAVLPALLADDRVEDVHAVASTLATQLQEPTQAPVFTARELAILRAVGQGLGERAIADRLGLSEHELRAQLDSVYRKTGAKDGSEFDRLAAEAASTLPRGGRRNWRSSPQRPRW